MDLVSILILTYNRPKYLKEAICGVLEQDYKNFELIILDNGSDEDTVNLVNSFSDKRVRCIRNNINSRNFVNIAFTLNLGKFFIITHDDDIMEKNFISREVQILQQNSDVVLVGSNTILIDKETNIIKPRTFNIKNDIKWQTTEFIKYYLMHGNIMPCPTIMFRTDYIKQNNLSFRLESGPMADLFLLFEINLMGKEIYMIKDPIYNYRLHENQDSEINRVNMEIQVRPYLLKLLNNFKEKELSKKYLKSSSAQILSLLIYHLLLKKISFKSFTNKLKVVYPNGVSLNYFTLIWTIKGIMRGLKKLVYDII